MNTTNISNTTKQGLDPLFLSDPLFSECRPSWGISAILVSGFYVCYYAGTCFLKFEGLGINIMFLYLVFFSFLTMESEMAIILRESDESPAAPRSRA